MRRWRHAGGLPHGPGSVGIGASDVFERGAARLAVDVLNDLVGIEPREIDSGPTRQQRQRALEIGVASVIGELGLSFGVAGADDCGGEREHQNALRIASELGEMVERRDAAGEGVGMLERDRRRDAEPEIFGDQRHRRHELQWIVDRDLGRDAQRRVEIGRERRRRRRARRR